MIKFTKDNHSISLPTPDRIERKIVHAIQSKDLRSESDFIGITHLLYTYPEREVWLFLESKLKSNNFIISKLEQNGVLCDTTEYYYYKHPQDENCFLKISGNDFQFEWERAVVEKGPMFGRIILTLSERKERELEIQQKIDQEKESDNNPIELKPNFCGIGLDVYKFAKWLKRLILR